MREPRQVNLDVFSPEEVMALVRAAESEQDAAIYLTAAFTGLRRGELIALRWRDLDFAGCVIRVRASYSAGALSTPKSGKRPRVARTTGHGPRRLDSMSTAQRNDARLIPVDPQLGDVLRTQTRAVLVFNHHYFDDLLAFGPAAQHALSIIYRDAFGWHPNPNPNAAATDVPLTAGHIDQLRRCRYDLGMTNLGRLDDRDATTDPDVLAEIDGEIRTNRNAAQSLDRLISAYYGARVSV